MAAMGTGKTQAGLRTASLTALALGLVAGTVLAQPPSLDAIFPAGGQAGQVVNVTVHGARLEGLTELRSSVPGSGCKPAGPGVFQLTIPQDTPTGSYDLWAVGANGISAPRTFVIGDRSEQLETEPNDVPSAAMQVPLNLVINGRIEKPGDVDHFRFAARRDQIIVMECWGERIDSKLRGLLELDGPDGLRSTLSVKRDTFGVDQLIAFFVREDGEYVLRLTDLGSSGGPEYFYRLAIGDGPHVAFCRPNVVQRGRSARIEVHGWNLPGASDADDGMDKVEIDFPAVEPEWPLPALLRPAQATLADAAVVYRFPGAPAPVMIGLTDAPVALDGTENHSPASAHEIEVPSEICGQLGDGWWCDWYALRAQRGEVLHIEGYGQRIGSRVDLQINVFDESASAVSEFSDHGLAEFNDELRNMGGEFPTNHFDPIGRWICPSDGRYFIAVRNLTSGFKDNDPRHLYRLRVRREDADFHVVAVPQGSPPAVNLTRGGRAVLDLLAFRERGMTGGIRVSAGDLPTGVTCPDVWIGPGVDRALLVISADQSATEGVAELRLEATEDQRRTTRPVLAGTVVRGGTPNGWGRLISQLPFAVAGESPVRITARADEPLDHHLYGELNVRHAPGSIVDVHVEVARRDAAHAAAVRLSAIGLPEAIETATAILSAGEHSGWVSFRLPATLPVGTYSLAIAAETTASVGGKVEPVRVVSNPVVFRVEPAAFQVAIDPFAVTRVRRGEVFQLAYSAKRLNGFIGKMHTELAVPGHVTDIPDLRGRGETFVSQTETGSLQITVNDDAPLGPQQSLRLFTVGVVEDEPTYFGSCPVPLEIVE